MIDSLLQHRHRAVAPPQHLPAGFGVVTLHRPSNVDQPDALADSLDVLRAVSAIVPLVCALHPRTQANIASFGLGRSEEHTSELQSQSNLVCRLLLEKKKKHGET